MVVNIHLELRKVLDFVFRNAKYLDKKVKKSTLKTNIYLVQHW